MDQSMKAFVGRQNIMHLAKLLNTETDPVERAMSQGYWSMQRRSR
jgi:hypothetical protein